MKEHLCHLVSDAMISCLRPATGRHWGAGKRKRLPQTSFTMLEVAADLGGIFQYNLQDEWESMGEKCYHFIRGIAAEAELVVRVLTPRNIAPRMHGSEGLSCEHMVYTVVGGLYIRC